MSDKILKKMKDEDIKFLDRCRAREDSIEDYGSGSCLHNAKRRTFEHVHVRASVCRILTRFTPQYYSLVGHSGARRFLFLLLNETSVPHAQGPFEPIIATDVTAHYNTRRREVIVLGGELHVCQVPPILASRSLLSVLQPHFEGSARSKAASQRGSG